MLVQSRSNDVIDLAIDLVIERDGVATPQTIFNEIEILRLHWARSTRWDLQRRAVDALDAIEDILQHSYDVVV